ncbi:putative Anticodon-binding domain [Monocercomonoides exilis]|uniref:putative Anticodon-binding domain n=1 Tax=Monocercomonoides exilis TaxID=2049356 RepID=UPI003559486B|nr:putative Anticodon-binding domain [Monocercomonoides exilis]|eukprot:MONOS_10095.1-p1 / transcript=MONOS_10095.1 / gene=MONOS_10095 / organism=Monocercomonoides_exilis_PA203 / gene_product=unspecified product / transcript_product=unspecified product / location=Mono_scaffold00443:47043-47762(+) / protein_length=198 / sequence_SO=supercontig / SO=protein_coding / is_pseudo=false
MENDFSKIQQKSYLRCSTIWGEDVEGYFYAIDEENNQIILENESISFSSSSPILEALYKPAKLGEHSLRFLSCSAIKGFMVLRSSSEIETKERLRFERELPYVYDAPDDEALKRKEKTAIQTIRERQNHIKPGISEEIQSLFNHFCNMYPDCHWEGDSMIIMGIRIEPPYQPESCKGEPEVTLERIRKNLKQKLRLPS